ncbi:MAG: MarR family transcriptional regulator [Comamonadaceae bacterium]|nr:MarR family transcriptional regulator [Comamonadaceae bacterium]
MAESLGAPLYDGASYDPDVSVGRTILQLSSLIRREVDGRMAEHGLTDAQWKPLWLLKIGRADTANELARQLDCDAGAVTRLVDRLEAKGLLERVRSDADRRVVHLQLDRRRARRPRVRPARAGRGAQRSPRRLQPRRVAAVARAADSAAGQRDRGAGFGAGAA